MTPFQEWWASLPPNEGFRDEEHLAELAWAAATAAERERAAKIVELTEVEGDYTGRDAEGGSYWEGSPGLTLRSAAKRIRDGVQLPEVMG